MDLRKDIEERETVATVSGSITEEVPSDNPIVFAIFSERMLRQNVVNRELTRDRDYSLSVFPGEYYIGAFVDANGDQQFQTSELHGYYGYPGEPVPIEVGDGEKRTNVDFDLVREVELPDLGPDDGEFPLLWRGRKNIGAIASLDDDQFSAENGSMGLWQPLNYSVEFGPGVFFLRDYDPAKIPVLFIHGVAGSPRDWQAMIESLEPERFQFWVLAYASGFPVDDTSEYLSEAISELRIRYGFDRLYLIAHSLGGLVGKSFIDTYDHGELVKLFVTLSTPWDGHQAAQFGVNRAPVIVPVWHDIAPGSELLASLKNQTLPEPILYHLMFSFRGRGLPSTTSSDGTVTLASQLEQNAQNRANRLYGIDATHVGILSDPLAIQHLKAVLANAERSGES